MCTFYVLISVGTTWRDLHRLSTYDGPTREHLAVGVRLSSPGTPRGGGGDGGIPLRNQVGHGCLAANGLANGALARVRRRHQLFPLRRTAPPDGAQAFLSCPRGGRGRRGRRQLMVMVVEMGRRRVNAAATRHRVPPIVFLAASGSADALRRAERRLLLTVVVGEGAATATSGRHQSHRRPMIVDDDGRRRCI